MKRLAALAGWLLLSVSGVSGDTITFDDIPEGDIVSTQYYLTQGVSIFNSPVVLTAGSWLNELDFPPKSAPNVLADLRGPVTFVLSQAQRFASGYLTYTVPVTVLIYDSDEAVIGTYISAAESNLGSQEFFSITAPPGVTFSELTISGDSAGSSFVVDDVSFGSTTPQPTTVPEPGSALLFLTALSMVIWRRRGNWTCLGLMLLLAGAAAMAQVNNLVPVPDLVFTGVPTPVTLIANVEPSPNLLADSVNLTEVDAAGRLIRVIGRMYDDGTHGDALARDYNYSVQTQVFQVIPTTQRYVATAALRGSILRISSPIATVTVAPASYSKPPDPSRMVTDLNGRYPYDQALVTVASGTTLAGVQALASSVGGAVVGYSSSANTYQFDVPATNSQTLDAIISTLSASPFVVMVTRNLAPTFTVAADNDLAQLRATDMTKTAAYDKIQVSPGYQSLLDFDTRFSPIRVGVLDTGVLPTHEEFAGVSLFGATTDAVGHGTSVTGIIGANNRTAFGAYRANHMNGLLAGVGSNANPSGSKVPYAIEVQHATSVMDIMARIDELAANGARVINMSLGMIKTGALTPACANVLQIAPLSLQSFNNVTTLLTNVMRARNTKLFVVAAGNEGIDRSNDTPANIDRPNVLTVAATDLADGRAIWSANVAGFAGCSSSSNFGAGVDLAAPGVDVYAPDVSVNRWRMFTGTSAATPLVAGTAAMLLSINPGLVPDDLVRILQKTADDIATDNPLGGKRLNFKAAVRYAAQPVDVFLLIDTTGSFHDDITKLQDQANILAVRLMNEKVNVHMGLGHFEDYPIPPFGMPPEWGDRAYRRVQDLVSLTLDTNRNGTPDIIEAIYSLGVWYGSDTPEAQLPALFQVATGAGQIIPDHPEADIPAGQQATWRDNSLRIVILWTDAQFHVAGDVSVGPNTTLIIYPGPTWEQTLGALIANKIHVIGILAGISNPARSDLMRVANSTSTFAPPGGVDCDGNGTIDILEGQPLVCPIATDGSGVSQAIVNTILAVAKQ